MGIVSKVVKDMVTEDDDGTIYCYVRVLSILAGVVILGVFIYLAVSDIVHFDFKDSCIGISAYFTSIGAAIWAKAKGTGA